MTHITDAREILIDGAAPLRTAAPREEAECVDIIADGRRNVHALVPVGGGTALQQGNLLTRPDWQAVSTANLAEIADYSPDDMVVTAGAGTTLANLQRMLGAHGQFVPLDVPNPEIATLGGIVATNAQGLWRPAYGSPRDRLLGVRVAMADGSVVRGGGKVVKNVAGYDLCKLFGGSWGTLGLITEVTFKTNPLPPSRVHRTYAGRGVAQTIAAALRVRFAQLDPAYVVVSMIERATVLAVGMHGSELAVQWQSDAIEAMLRREGLDPSDGPGEVIPRHAIADSPLPLKARITVRPTDLPAVAEAIESVAELLICHVQTGIVEAAFGLPDSEAGEGFAHVRRTVEGAAGARGYAVWTSVPPDLKAGLDVWGPPRPDHVIMRKIKQALDPDNLFSPGRFAGRI
jgi:glycolate oxidase FAD binding subunit